MKIDTISLSESLHDFIRSHINEDPDSLRLRFGKKQLDFDIEFAITQIEGRKRFKKKLPGYIANPDFLFPTVVSGEQASHEAVANFHASLIPDDTDVVDMTAGLGIDSLAISTKAKNVISIELENFKAEILRHNSKALGRDNIKILQADSIKWFEEINNANFDVAFIDPSRRGEGNSRLYNLRECSPDIITHQNLILGKCKVIFVKASPMLDISQTLRDFPSLTGLKCNSVDGECKEILLELRKSEDSISFEAINLKSNGNEISRFSYNSQDPGKEIQWARKSDLNEKIYLYEPDASVMKLAPWNQLSQKYDSIRKIGPSSHLFISEDLYLDFPGRVMNFLGIITNKEIKKLKGEKINVVTRNYPISADCLRKKISLKEGIDRFLYGTRIGNDPILLLTERIK